MKPTYYNEFDSKAAAWLRELIAQGHLPAGDVDERSICDVQPDDLRGYGACHFFAGIGGWALALRLAGVPDDAPIWTGSCPCQPFSCAGKQRGTADERHLWPEFFRLIRERRPVRVFGEQVAGAIGHGWLDGVRADVEAEGYALGAVVLGAHSVGAPHIRQRLYWVADAMHAGRPERRAVSRRRQIAGSGQSGESIADRFTKFRHGDAGGLGDADDAGPQGRIERDGRTGELPTRAPGAWSNFDILPCRDGKSRRVESGTFPLAHGVPARVVRLRGYGNAIVPQVAAEFVRAAMEATA